MAAITTIDRTQVVAGPCMITHDGVTFIFEDALTVKFTTDKLEIKVNGIVRDYTVLSKNIVITGKPVGMFRDTPKIFLYQTLLPGSFIYGADKPLLLQPYDTTQNQTTYATAAITKMPDLNLSAGSPMFDNEIEFTCLGKNNTLSSDAAYRYVEAANTFAGNDHYDPTKLIIQPYDLSHPLLNGGNPFDTEAGLKVAWNLSLTNRNADSVGVYQKQFTSINPTATFIPVGVNADDVRAALALQGAASVRGSRLSASSGNLVAQGTNVYFRLPNATIAEGSDVYGTAAARVGQLTCNGTGATGTAASPFFILGTAAPV